MPGMNDYLANMRWSEVQQTEGYKNGTSSYRDKIKAAWFNTRVAPIIPDIPEVKDYAWKSIFGEPISQAVAREKKYEGEERLSAQAVADPSSVRTQGANVAQFVRGMGQSIQAGKEGTIVGAARTPELLERSVYDTMMTPWNLMSRLIGRPDWQATYENMIRPTSLAAKLSDTVASPHFKAQQEILDSMGQQKSILEELKQGNISGAAKALVYGFFQNAPQLALSAAISFATKSPQSAMYTMGAMSGAQQLSQVSAEHPEMSSGAKTANAMANGALEGIFESLGTVKILDRFLNTSAKKELFKKGTQRAMTRFLKEFGKGAWQEGPMEEAPTQLTQNLNDIAFGLKPATWDNLFSGVFDASAIGAVSGGTMGGGLSLLQGSESGKTDAGTTPSPPSGNLEISPEDQVAIQNKFLQSHGINVEDTSENPPPPPNGGEGGTPVAQSIDAAIENQMKMLPAPEQPLLIEQSKQGVPINIDLKETEMIRDQIKDHLRQILRDHPESAQTITAYEDYLDAVYEKNPGAMYQAYKGITEMPLEAFLPTDRYSGNDISPERAESLYRSITNKLLDIKKNEPKLKDRVDYYWERVKELKDADPRRLVRIYDDLSRIQYVSRTEFSVRPGASVVGATIQTPGESAAGSPNEVVNPAETTTLSDAVKAADLAVSPEAVNQAGLATPNASSAIPTQQGVPNGEAQVQAETAPPPAEGRQEEGELIPNEQKVSPPSMEKPVPQSVPSTEKGGSERVEGKTPSKSVDNPVRQPKKKSATKPGKPTRTPKETLPAGVVRTKEVGDALRVGYDSEGKPVAAWEKSEDGSWSLVEPGAQTSLTLYGGGIIKASSETVRKWVYEASGRTIKEEKKASGKDEGESDISSPKLRRIVSQIRSLLPEAELLIFDRLTVKNLSGGISHLNGAYLQGVVLLDQDPANTTGYHEVFHGYLDMFTSPGRRAALFKQFREKTGLKGATDDEIEEVLARDFAQYALSKGKASPKGFIQRFYEQVKRFIQHLLGRLDLVKVTYEDILSLRRSQPNPYADMTGRGETLLGEILNGTARAKKETKDPALEDFLPHYPAGAMAFGHGLYFDSIQQVQEVYSKASGRPGAYNGPGKLSNPSIARWEETLSDEQKAALVGAMNKAKAAGIFVGIPEETKASQKYSLPGSRTIPWDSSLSEIYSALSENLNGDARASEILAEIGLDGHTVRMPSGGEQIVIYSEAVSAILSRLQSLNMKPLSEAQRKKMEEFNPAKEEIRQTGKEVARFVNDLAVPLERYLENLSSSLVSAYGKGIRSFDYLVNKFSNRRKIKLRPWVKKFRAMARVSLSDAKRYALSLFNGDIATVLEMNRKYGISPEEWASVKDVLDEMIEQAREVGYSVEYLYNYFPRFVKYKQAFLEALESGNQGFIAQTLNAYKKAKGLTVLTDDEKIQAISQILNMYHDHLTNGKPSSFQQRQIRYIDEVMLKYYYDPAESLLRYVNHVTQAIETRRFFGGKQEAAKGGDEVALLDNTLDMLSEYRSEKVLNENIARYINELMKSGEIVSGQEEETIRHLRAKFGYRGIRGFPAMMRNLGVVLILNSVYNALTQVCDIAYSLYRPGGARIAPAELIKAISGRSEITKEKLGIDRIMEEFVIQGRLGKIADMVMTGSLLRAFDRIGKQTLANTVISSMREDAKNGKFRDKNLRLLERSFDKSQLPEVIDDLKSGRLSDKVLFLAYNAIADVQALTNSQTPLYYSTMPPMVRLMFQFKTFTVVQVNFIRNESIDLIRKGKVKEGMTNLVWLGTLFLVLGASTRWLKDLLSGRPIHIENYMLETLLNIFGVNRYQFYKAAEVIDRDQPQEALTLLASSTIAPSVTPLIQMGIDAGKVVRHLADKAAGKAGKLSNVADLKSTQFIPLVGQYVYWNWGGGPARVDKKEIKTLKDDLEKLYNLPVKDLTDKKRKEISEKEDRLYELLDKQQQKQIEESDRQQKEIDAADSAEQEE